MSTVETGALDEGRAAFERHDWEKAYELLAAADSERGLEGPDIERLAGAAVKGLSEPVRLARIGWR